MRIKIILVSLCALFASFAASMFIYENLIVPNLDQWKEIPNFWWMILLSPILVVAVWAGYISKYIKDIALIAIIGGVVRIGFEYWKATSNRSGYLKYPLVEGHGFEYILLHIAINSFFLFCLLLIGWWGAKIKNIYNS
jgi:hypothetical protein